jgi:hypothetical protein
MQYLKGLQRTLLYSAFAVLAFGAAPAKAVTSDTNFGSCIGAAGGSDCVTAVGHISASVVGTLSINEMRAISFGNFAVTCGAGCTGASTIQMDIFGTRAAASGGTETITLLHGLTPGAAIPSGSQSPGHYTVSAADENNAASTQVYISFADNAGNVIDACSPPNSTGGDYAANYSGAPGSEYAGAPGTCDNYHPGAGVVLTGPGGNTFFVDRFTFNESGSDVYGHYIDNAAAVSSAASTTPFKPGSGAGTGHDNGTGTPGGAGANNTIDVVVGATLHTVAAATYPAGRYTGTYDIMVSY